MDSAKVAPAEFWKVGKSSVAMARSALAAAEQGAVCLVPATMRVVADADEKRVGNMMAQGAVKLILKDHGKDDEMPFFRTPS